MLCRLAVSSGPYLLCRLALFRLAIICFAPIKRHFQDFIVEEEEDGDVDEDGEGEESEGSDSDPDALTLSPLHLQVVSLPSASACSCLCMRQACNTRIL